MYHQKGLIVWGWFEGTGLAILIGCGSSKNFSDFLSLGEWRSCWHLLAVAASPRLLGAFTCSVVCSGITACLHLQTDECECEALESFHRRRLLFSGFNFQFLVLLALYLG